MYFGESETHHEVSTIHVCAFQVLQFQWQIFANFKVCNTLISTSTTTQLCYCNMAQALDISSLKFERMKRASKAQNAEQLVVLSTNILMCVHSYSNWLNYHFQSRNKSTARCFVVVETFSKLLINICCWGEFLHFKFIACGHEIVVNDCRRWSLLLRNEVIYKQLALIYQHEGAARWHIALLLLILMTDYLSCLMKSFISFELFELFKNDPIH